MLQELPSHILQGFPKTVASEFLDKQISYRSSKNTHAGQRRQVVTYTVIQYSKSSPRFSAVLDLFFVPSLGTQP